MEPDRAALPGAEEAGPDLERIRARLAAPTPVTWALLAAVLAAFVALLAIRQSWSGAEWSAEDAFHPLPAELAASFEPGPGDLARPAEWWRVAAAPFVKWNVFSLALSLWWMFRVGRRAEQILGGGGLLAVFFGGALAGALAATTVGRTESTSFPALFAISPALLAAARGRDVPAELARALRRQFFSSLVWSALLTAIFYAIFAAQGARIPVPWRPWVAGIGGGLAVGLLLHAKIRRPDLIADARSNLVKAVLGGGGAVLFALAIPHAAAIASAEYGSDARESPLREAPTERREVARFGIALDVPKGWMEARLDPKQAKHSAAFHPPEGGAMMHVLVVPKYVFSAFTAPGGDVQLEELRREHPEVVAGNFVRARVAGLSATRFVARYRLEGREIEEARYIVSGKSSTYTFIFAGAPRFAQMLADSTMRTVEIHE